LGTAGVIVCAAIVLNRARRGPEPELFGKNTLSWSSGSMSITTDSGPPPAVFLPYAKPKCQPYAFDQNAQFELLPPSRTFRARSNEPVPSQSVDTPTSMMCLPELSCTKRDVFAPPGKLGIILKQGLYGPMIHSVKPESPMVGKLFKEDLIISFNDRVSDALLSIIHNVSTHSKMFIMFLHRMSRTLMRFV
jgi:hypothetical protein